MPRPQAKTLYKTCARPECGQPFDVPDKVNYRERLYCSKACSNKATAARRAESIRAAKRYQPPICPCGNEVPPPPGQSYIYQSQKKYCSAACRELYGAKRQADPANYVTFNCLNCEKEVTRYRKYGSGANKYCSNECAAKHTRIKQHIVVDDAVVLDSGFEALFWGLCSILKIPVERGDRSQAVAIGDGWYCPDFWLPQQELWVEVKGFEDEDDRGRYEAWRAAGRPWLAVLDKDALDLLRIQSQPALFIGRLFQLARRRVRQDA